MSGIVKVLIIVCFVVYWIVNLFFNFPDNPIKIKFSKQESAFQSVLFQRWSFFAPPPKANDRLYYFFRNPADTAKIEIFEALSSIAAKKQEKAPFNMLEEKYDYILSGSISEIQDYLRTYTNGVKYRTKKDPGQETVLQAMNEAWAVRERLSGIKTLLKYGNVIAQQNGIPENYEMKFLIIETPIPKFVDRHKHIKEIEVQNTKTFETPYIRISKL